MATLYRVAWSMHIGIDPVLAMATLVLFKPKLTRTWLQQISPFHHFYNHLELSITNCENLRQQKERPQKSRELSPKIRPVVTKRGKETLFRRRVPCSMKKKDLLSFVIKPLCVPAMPRVPASLVLLQIGLGTKQSDLVS